jgi:hypothetical protein
MARVDDATDTRLALAASILVGSSYPYTYSITVRRCTDDQVLSYIHTMTDTPPERDSTQRTHTTDGSTTDRSETMKELSHRSPTDGPTRSFERGTEGRDEMV